MITGSDDERTERIFDEVNSTTSEEGDEEDSTSTVVLPSSTSLAVLAKHRRPKEER